jgi:hypothetical protein
LDDFLAKGGHGDHHSPVEFEVTLENLTPATGEGSSQPFSPHYWLLTNGNCVCLK